MKIAFGQDGIVPIMLKTRSTFQATICKRRSYIFESKAVPLLLFTIHYTSCKEVLAKPYYRKEGV